MKTENVSTPATRVLRLKDVKDRLGLSRSTIYDRINEKSPRYDGSFPLPVSLGGSSIGWIEEEISAWLKSRPTSKASRASNEAREG